MKTLIALDSSRFSNLILDDLRTKTWPLDTTIELLSVVQPISNYGFYPGYYYPEEFFQVEETSTKNGMLFLDDAKASLLETFPHLHVETKVTVGNPADTILEEAEDFAADLIIVGSHGRTGIQKFLLGSVSSTVASNAPCSVHIVKEKKPSPKAVKMAAAAGRA